MALKWLQTFITAAKYSNYSITAEKLYMAQPTVSLHIKNLEKALNTKLFEKNGRNIELTSGGKIFLLTAEKMMEEFNQGLENISHFDQIFNTTYSCATAPSIAINMMPKFCQYLFQYHPKIDLTIDVIKSIEIEREILVNKIDFGLSRIKPKSKNMTYKKILEDRIVLVVSNTSKFSNISFQSLVNNHRMLTNELPYYTEEIIPCIQDHYPQLSTMKLAHSEVIKSFLLQGIGFAFLPHSSIHEELELGLLKIIESTPISDFLVSTIYFCYKKNNHTLIELETIMKQFITSAKLTMN
ncbi:LysR family transcriptional regulator [Carnobacterium gallinarum]|uniref:LysR family transcriptional regulator n=1 Tax=Carnobacterium gallinarum TaxID=2749 RepID=UPI000551767D|nr:LysR family transcriptional regulator [Carnobacterium gallinarum]